MCCIRGSPPLTTTARAAPFQTCCARPLRDDCADDRAAAGARVEVHQDDLLPFACEQLPVTDRHSEPGSEQRAAYVTVAVVIIPSGFVLVVVIVGDQALKELGDVVLDQARFELD